ncbi:MAG TPA: EthD family reductase [Alphaproteobacteria bacterium]|nr:EthD family reductase [Alphaproteobacteria bacterium]
MIVKVSILYPNLEGSRFNMDYYCKFHVPMLQQRLGAACRQAVVEQGISGAAPGSPPTYVAMGHFYFDSVEAFQAAFRDHAAAIEADVPNYTDIEPITQISLVKS